MDFEIAIWRGDVQVPDRSRGMVATLCNIRTPTQMRDTIQMIGDTADMLLTDGHKVLRFNLVIDDCTYNGHTFKQALEEAEQAIARFAGRSDNARNT